MMRANSWTQEEDQFLRANWCHMSLAQLAAALGRTERAVAGRKTRIGCAHHEHDWSAADVAALRELYAGPLDRNIDLKGFAARIGRDKANVCRKAKELGLARNNSRRSGAVWKCKIRMYATRDEWRAAIGRRTKEWIATHGHPCGATGLRHTEKTRARVGAANHAQWERDKAAGTGYMSPENRQRRSNLMSQRQANDPRMRTGFSLGSQGRREDLGGQYFRSTWEANIARYLNWLKEKGEIHSWEYEPDTFWFEQIKRGVRSYKPDFRIKDRADSEPYYWEVKGWDYPRGKTARERMARYYPRVKLVLIDADAYKAIAKWRDLIPGWEVGGTGGRRRVRAEDLPAAAKEALHGIAVKEVRYD